ncbi:hypothetical protein [Thermogemmatispora tikiterensis]|uniref:Methyltransferase type 11 domain-containing protein n=1 Tax=Thermogemmatispora tikiterensis TaxID=1825093 RepID=A0A328VBE1_9CHLR|nr:hypothetical protein [Thermogemmatispora tikiterensis]RAQ94061.1 hypothetical protein A4R35_00855 [Thermogemmatispora tikiterensis]
MVAIPAQAWPGVVRELVRVTRPGGWIELLELSDGIQPAGPATRRLFDWFTGISRQLGFELAVLHQLGELLQQAGCVEVTSQDIPAPPGRWAGATGQLLLTDVLQGINVLKDALCPRTATPPEQVDQMLREAAQEWMRLQAWYVFHAASGRRPGA